MSGGDRASSSQLAQQLDPTVKSSRNYDSGLQRVTKFPGRGDRQRNQLTREPPGISRSVANTRVPILNEGTMRTMRGA
jgi:hypothetical protein